MCVREFFGHYFFSEDFFGVVILWMLHGYFYLIFYQRGLIFIFSHGFSTFQTHSFSAHSPSLYFSFPDDPLTAALFCPLSSLFFIYSQSRVYSGFTLRKTWGLLLGNNNTHSARYE